MDDRALELALADVGAHLDHAVPTRMRDAVRSRIAERRARAAQRRGRSVLVPLAVTAVLLLLVVALASPQVRAKAEEILRLRGIDIFRVPALPTPSPSGGVLFEGERVTLEEARRRSEFPILVPAALEAPDEVYLSGIPGSRRVTLVYHTRPGGPSSTLPGISTVLIELRAEIDESFIGKAVGPGTAIEKVTVQGSRAFWLSGAPHFFFYRTNTGDVRQETIRFAGNTLLWERGAVTLRLEAQVSRDEAVRIADTVR